MHTPFENKTVENEAVDDIPHVKFLKRLVAFLAFVMSSGFIVLIAALIFKLNADPVPLPERITLPEGMTAVSFTTAADWFAVVTDTNMILIYDSATGALRQEIRVD